MSFQGWFYMRVLKNDTDLDWCHKQLETRLSVIVRYDQDNYWYGVAQLFGHDYVSSLSIMKYSSVCGEENWPVLLPGDLGNLNTRLYYKSSFYSVGYSVDYQFRLFI